MGFRHTPPAETSPKTRTPRHGINSNSQFSDSTLAGSQMIQTPSVKMLGVFVFMGSF